MENQPPQPPQLPQVPGTPQPDTPPAPAQTWAHPAPAGAYPDPAQQWQAPSLSPAPRSLSSGVPWLAVVIVGGIVLGAAMIGMLTGDYDVAQSMTQVVFWIGLVFAAICGFTLAKLMANSTNIRSTSGGAQRSPLFTVGIVLCALSIIGGIITLIPGVICLVVGNKRAATLQAGPPAKPMGTGGKVALVGLSFFGGFIPAAFLALVLTVMVASHACDLSSSKCM